MSKSFQIMYDNGYGYTATYSVAGSSLKEQIDKVAKSGSSLRTSLLNFSSGAQINETIKFDTYLGSETWIRIA